MNHKFTEEEMLILGISKEEIPVIQPPPIPKTVTQSFIPPSWYPALSAAMIDGVDKGAMIFGPRGSGKTTAIRELAKAHSCQWETLQCAANMQYDSLIGTWSVVAGNTVFIDGKLTRCVREGKWLLAEEANVVAPGVWSQVNTLTDDSGEPLSLPTGEDVPRHPDFRLVLLFNEGSAYQGTKEVNGALKDRLMPIYANYPSPAMERTMLGNMLPGLNGAQLDHLIEIAGMIRAANMRFDLSIRALRRWGHLYLSGVGSWAECYRIAVLDLTGAPEITEITRKMLLEIAANCGMDRW